MSSKVQLRDLVGVTPMFPDQDAQEGSIQGTARMEMTEMMKDEGPAGSGFSSEVVQKNVELKANVVEYEELLETTPELQLEGCRTQRETLHLRSQKSLECIHQLDEEYRCPTSSNFRRSKLIDSLKLLIRNTLLVKNLHIAQNVHRVADKMMDPDAKAVDLKEMEKQSGGDDETGSAAGSARMSARQSVSRESIGAATGVTGRTGLTGGMSHISATPEDMGLVVARCEEVLNQLETVPVKEDTEASLKHEMKTMLGAFFPPIGQDLGTRLVLLNQFANKDVQKYVRKFVQQTEAKHTDCANRAIDVGREYYAIDPDDVEARDAALMRYIEAMDKALVSSKDRLNQMMMKSSDEGNFRSESEGAVSTSRQELETLRRRTKDVFDRSINDIQVIEREENRRTSIDEGETEKYCTQRDASCARMDELWTQQDALWAEIEEKVKIMMVIGAERAQIAREHLVKTEEEYRRRRFHAEWMAVAKKQKDHLSLILALGQQATKLLEDMDFYVDHIVAQLETKNLEEGLDELKHVDQEHYLKLYTPYVRASSAMLGSRLARKMLVERTYRIAESQLRDETSHEKATFRQVKNEAVKETRTLEEVIDQLQKRMRSWEKLYESVKTGYMGGNVPPNMALIQDPHVEGDGLLSRPVEHTRTAEHSAFPLELGAVESVESDLANHQAALEQLSRPRKRRQTPERDSQPEQLRAAEQTAQGAEGSVEYVAADEAAAVQQ